MHGIVTRRRRHRSLPRDGSGRRRFGWPGAASSAPGGGPDALQPAGEGMSEAAGADRCDETVAPVTHTAGAQDRRLRAMAMD